MLAMLRKATKFLATNKIENGDFSDGTTGWEGNLCTTQAVDRKCICTVARQDEPCGIYTFPAPSYISGHTYYVYGEIKPKYSVRARATVFGKMRYTDVTAGVFNRVSHVATNSGETSGVSLYHDARAATGYEVGDNFEIRNMFLVDLTATFGSSNEPTKEECDAIFAAWFDGTKNPLLRPHEMMAFCLRELHDIKAAIVSLGGQI